MTGGVTERDHHMPCILLINPNTSARSTEMMLMVARPFLSPGVTMRGVEASIGAAMIVDDAALAVGEQEVVRIGSVETEGVDAIIVAAFGNPGASRLRALLPVPVIGIGEAAVQEAAAGGRRFGIATTTPQLVRSIEASVLSLGLGGRFTGVRVPAGDPLTFAANPVDQDEALATAATQCIELDGAEAVVIGGGPLSDTAVRLRQRFPTAIIEPVPAAMRHILKEFEKSNRPSG
jgi:allantoin racemase